MEKAGCPVWPALIRAASCPDSAGGYSSGSGVCCSFLSPSPFERVGCSMLELHCARVFYVGNLSALPYVWNKEVCVVVHKS